MRECLEDLDAYYEVQIFRRQAVDREFRACVERSGAEPWAAWGWWALVRLLGWPVWMWRR